MEIEEVKERPILFSGPMVRAILEGRKTQTRRVVKPRPAYPDAFDGLRMEFSDLRCGMYIWNEGAVNPAHFWRCPYGKPGDRLWVRETWGTWEKYGKPVDRDLSKVAYRADGGAFVPDMGWKPSIHMPRWASRITLEITSVRVERLQDISEEDAQAEGVKTVWTGRHELPCGGVANAEFINYEPPAECELKDVVKAQTFRNRFAQLWDSINGVGSWDANPFVWVVEFKRVQP